MLRYSCNVYNRKVFTKIFKLLCCELCPIIPYNLIRNTKSSEDFMQNSIYTTLRRVFTFHNLWPFREYTVKVPSSSGLHLNSVIELITESREKEFILLCSFFNTNSSSIFQPFFFCFHSVLDQIVAALLDFHKFDHCFFQILYVFNKDEIQLTK